MQDKNVILEAKFDPKVKLYWYLQGVALHLGLTFALIGFITLPMWVLCGWWVVSKQLETMSASLTNNSIHLRKGVINQVEKTIPLEKIQDLGMRTGPLLNMFGLASISIETAGGSQQGPDMVLAGIIEPETFRNRVLAQRELVASGGSTSSAHADSTIEVLTEIKDSLQRIEGLLAAKGGQS